MRKCLNITYPFNIFIFYLTCIGILQCKNHIKQSLLNDFASDNFINEIYYIWSSWYIQRGLRVYLIKCVHQRRIGVGSNQNLEEAVKTNTHVISTGFVGKRRCALRSIIQIWKITIVIYMWFYYQILDQVYYLILY